MWSILHTKIRGHDEFVANLSSDQSTKSMHLGKGLLASIFVCIFLELAQVFCSMKCHGIWILDNCADYVNRVKYLGKRLEKMTKVSYLLSS
jgi:hypothetical protein